MKISLAHGDYCDGVDAGKIGACSLSRKLEQDFVFELSCEQLASQMVSSGTQDGGQKGVEGVRNVDVSWSITNTSNTTLLVQGENESDANLKWIEKLYKDPYIVESISTLNSILHLNKSKK